MSRSEDFMDVVREWSEFIDANALDGHLRVVEVGGSEVGDAYSFEDLGAVVDWVLRRSGYTPESVDNAIDVHIEVDYGAERAPQLATASVVDWSNGRLTLDWRDESITSLSFPAFPDGPLDQGAALLEPITAVELAGIERVLSVLEQQVRDGDLDQFIERRVLAIADIIRAERVAATPEVTERWVLVGPVRAALRYVLRDLPRDGLALVKFAEILAAINWHQLASSLPGV